jgi:tetratricopeptide (TPR) repeat protein
MPAAKLFVREQDGKTRVSYFGSDGLDHDDATSTEPFVCPLTEDELEDLRYYLEEYLTTPYAVYEERGQRIARSLHEWGVKLFQSLIGSSPEARRLYARALAQDHRELWLSSGSASFLGLPWELLHDPDRSEPAVFDFGTLQRTLANEVPSVDVHVGQELRVLLVVSRPKGKADVAYQSIARPLLAKLQASSARVSVDVLRPPTLQALERRLADAAARGERYHVLHFDGHGEIRKNGQTSEGFLLFEARGGGSDAVSADEFGRVLERYPVAALVLNACRSAMAAQGDSAESAIAARLVRSAAATVVAMSYAVYVVAAAEFMTAFYEALFAGQSVARAVRNGRWGLRRSDLRPSPKGPLPLGDWIVPVLYSREDIRFTSLEGAGPDAGSAAPLDVSATALPRALESEGEVAFVGRDREFYELESGFARQPIILLHGVGGTGKTELVKAFARWWLQSGALEEPPAVVLHSFEAGLTPVDFDASIARMASELVGASFAKDLDPASLILELARSKKMLFVWDGFEALGSGNERSEMRTGLQAFIDAFRVSARSRLLIVSRSPESWLGSDVHRIELGGLSHRDTDDYVESLLSKSPEARARRGERSYAELLELLSGHPLALRHVIPRLNEQTAPELIRALRADAGLSLAKGEVGRHASLHASIEYSLQHVHASHRSWLPALSLFVGTVAVDSVARFLAVPSLPERFRGVDTTRLERALADCVHVGLVAEMQHRSLRMDPAFSGYLRWDWEREAGIDFQAEEDAARSALIRVYAALSVSLAARLDAIGAKEAMRAVEVERAMLTNVLGSALERGSWQAAHDILGPLQELWDAREDGRESLAWFRRCRSLVERECGGSPRPDRPAGSLWLFAVGVMAGHAEAAGDHSAAEAGWNSIRAVLEKHEEPTLRLHLAIANHHLGTLALRRGDLAAAHRWYEACRRINDELGSRPQLATSYSGLGLVAHNRGEFAEADAWHRKSLAINDEYGDRQAMASDYYHLGLVARRLAKIGTAQEWFGQALQIASEVGDRGLTELCTYELAGLAAELGDADAAGRLLKESLKMTEHVGDAPSKARVYHSLGLAAQRAERFGEAERWFQMALAIDEELGDAIGKGQRKEALAGIAAERERYDAAEPLYLEALAVLETMGDRQDLARVCYRLGVVTQHLERFDEAAAWYRRSRKLAEEFGDRPGAEHAFAALQFMDLRRRLKTGGFTAALLHDAVNARSKRSLE